MQAARLLLRYERNGGACARKLRCKTNSTNGPGPGGPVSSNTNGTFPARSLAKGSVALWKFTGIHAPFELTAFFSRLTATARSVLQHGKSAAGFCFGGAECIGQSIALLGVEEVVAASAQ